MIKNNKKYLITTDNWFVAPDGEQYKSAYGKCKTMTTEEAFGFKPQRPSTNWFVICGTKNPITIAGCQIHYAIQCDKKPYKKTEKYKDGDLKGQVKNRIYYG